MNYYFITGTSSGIGKALAELLLEDQKNKVFGFSRKKEITHPNYQHVFMDLANARVVDEYDFPILEDAQKYVLVNNAGQIGSIKPVGKMHVPSFAQVFDVNVTAVAILTNNFIKRYELVNTQKVVLTVSSGAGKNPIEGWAAYCASKAAVDLFSLTVFEEQKRAQFPVKMYSIAPGVVDTQMQQEIRSSHPNDFPKHAHFVDLKSNSGLSAPRDVAAKYVHILNHTGDFEKCVFSLRDLT